MAKMQLALVIGGAVASSVGAAFKNVEGRISKLEAKGNKAKVLKATIGETQKLQAEWKRAHDSGAAGADKLLRKLNGNLDALRKQGIEVGRLSREYQRLSREAKGADLQLKGHQQIDAGRSGLKTTAGVTAAGIGLAAVPTKISADYQAIIRDIAIKADAVNKPEEVQLSRTVIQTATDTGMARNDVADLINQLVGAGMELDKAMAYAPTAAKFAVGQGASGVDTASMIMALQQNAKITDPKVMQQALEAIAYQGQAGSFEASDMAKWFPQLLAGMEKNGSTGLDAVTSLGAMLQVQMKTAGSSDEAANNFKNWMEKIGSGDVVKAYKDVGIDYQASLNTGLQKGMSVIESSMALAMKYVEATDPAKAKKIKDAQANIDKEVDPEKARAALEALEKTLRTGDLFADMQVKAALTAYAQNRGLYADLKAQSTQATGILDKNLAERRETSKQAWGEAFQALDDSMRSVGDAIRPMTDAVAKAITATANGFTKLSDDSKPVVAGIVAVSAGFVALKGAFSAFKIGKGALNILRGGLSGRAGGDGVQKVFVTNSDGANEQESEGGGSRREKVLDLLATGLKAFRKPKEGAGETGAVEGGADAEPEKLDAVGVGLKVLDIFRDAGNDSDGGGEGSEPQKVFVVNSGDFGGLGGAAGGAGPGEQGRRSRRGRNRRRGRGAGAGAGGSGPRPGPRPSPPPPHPPAPAPSRFSRVGQMVHGVRDVTRGLEKLPGGKLLDVVPGLLDTVFNAETQDEKAEGYGGVAGGAAGAWAGAAVGATIGSVVPVIGTAIGGAIGAALGGLGGESVGGWLGKRLFGEDQPAEVAEAKPEAQEAPKVEAPVIGAAVAAKPEPKPVAPVVGDVVKAKPAAENVAPVPAPGAVVRSLDKDAPPPAPVVKPAEKAKAEPAKVDQSFTFAPNMPITVHGDVKDPNQIVREAEQALRAMWENFQREVASRTASTQLYDAADVA
ncbi:phage tail tape measure protein [Pseudomonas sp.]|uniref:phage tail tape measure protein n=1 Tax=Pseudomonas sp. TaxID=306 RepID=UPI0028AD4BDC|nr:phage tail tape measure protein [Pseudomonas sp.]